MLRNYNEGLDLPLPSFEMQLVFTLSIIIIPPTGQLHLGLHEMGNVVQDGESWSNMRIVSTFVGLESISCW